MHYNNFTNNEPKWYNIIMKQICEKLKELRLKKGLSQNSVAKIINVSRVVYNRYENDQREIPLELLCSLADYYKVSLDYLAGRED